MAPDHPNASVSGLGAKLSAVLPKGYQFGVYHLSTPPYKSDALFSAPPDERPDRTYCENHFLAITIHAPQQNNGNSNGNDAKNGERKENEILILGIEIFIYTTAHSSTLFVSKADSTGYLQLLNLPKGTTSPIRAISSAFVEFLVAERKRKDVQFVVSLFARAQDQYLFPGSVKYPGKHVLDDRGLVKWWCRVLSSMLGKKLLGGIDDPKGYLVVPGLEPYETKALLPKPSLSSWELGHPLEKISHYTREFDWVPPRCLIPKFPDDPKSRFRDELDEEAFSSAVMKKMGSWKSVKTLDVFWEMMAFRQECSSGRMTGFIWVVFEDGQKNVKKSDSKELTVPGTPKKNKLSNISPLTTPKKVTAHSNGSVEDITQNVGQKAKDDKEKKKKKKKKLRGPIKACQPKIKTDQRKKFLKIPVTSPYYYWPEQGRGENLVDQDQYKRCVELLLHLDFENLEKGLNSTTRWSKDVGMGKSWGYTIEGTVPTPEAPVGGTEASNGVNNLSGLVKRKRGDEVKNGGNDGVNVLNTGLVRKKAKVEPVASEGEVNKLNAGLVREKPKA